MSQPKTVAAVCQYILQYQDAIYIRVQLDGKWQSVVLSQVPTKQALEWVLTWLQDYPNQVPHRVEETER